MGQVSLHGAAAPEWRQGARDSESRARIAGHGSSAMDSTSVFTRLATSTGT